MTDSADIIDALIERRHAMGLTQKDLAEKTRLKQPPSPGSNRKKSFRVTIWSLKSPALSGAG